MTVPKHVGCSLMVWCAYLERLLASLSTMQKKGGKGGKKKKKEKDLTSER